MSLIFIPVRFVCLSALVCNLITFALAYSIAIQKGQVLANDFTISQAVKNELSRAVAMIGGGITVVLIQMIYLAYILTLRKLQRLPKIFAKVGIVAGSVSNFTTLCTLSVGASTYETLHKFLAVVSFSLSGVAMVCLLVCACLKTQDHVIVKSALCLVYFSSLFAFMYALDVTDRSVIAGTAELLMFFSSFSSTLILGLGMSKSDLISVRLEKPI